MFSLYEEMSSLETDDTRLTIKEPDIVVVMFVLQNNFRPNKKMKLVFWSKNFSFFFLIIVISLDPYYY